MRWPDAEVRDRAQRKDRTGARAGSKITASAQDEQEVGSFLPAINWSSSTITEILSLQEYCGDGLNFKTYSISYKHRAGVSGRARAGDRPDNVGAHSGETRQGPQAPDTGRRENMFSGLLVCSDCGQSLHYHFSQSNPDIKYFNCSNYKGNRGTCSSTHYIRVDFLEQVVLGEIRRLTRFASRYEKEFAQAVMGHSQQSLAQKQQMKQKELKKLLARDAELDSLFESIYEDNVSGKLSDSRFGRMSVKYDEEQHGVQEKVKKLKTELEKASGKTVTADMFISTVRKYTRARKLTPRMLNELIDHIAVHQAEKVDGADHPAIRSQEAVVQKIKDKVADKNKTAQ